MGKRKATGSPHSSPGRSKTPRGQYTSPRSSPKRRGLGGGQSSSSSQHVTHSTSRAANTKLFPLKHSGQVPSLNLVKLELDLYKRFEDTTLEVDSLTHIPLSVWKLSGTDLYPTDKTKISIERPRQVCPVPDVEIKDDCLRAESIDYVLHTIFRASGILISYRNEENKNRWRFQEGGEQDHLEISAGAGGSGDAERKTDDEDDGGGDEALEKDDHKEDPDEIIYRLSVIGLSDDLFQHMVSAFIHHMTNAKGRRFMETLLKLASTVCFGPKLSKDVFVLNVGTSTQKHEGFPVTQVEFSSPTCSVSGSVDGSVTSFGDYSGLVYPDTVVVSRDDAGSARYLLVTEIKSSQHTLTHSEISQLYREMLGAGINQTEVFGVIINSMEAHILRMVNGKKGEAIQFAEAVYVFSPLSGSTSLNTKVFGQFFLDLVKVLNYAYTHISELKLDA